MTLRDEKARATVAPGTILAERFEVLEVLGAGCFGAVYRARQLAFGHRLREVALKLFAVEKINEGNVRKIFSDAVVLMSLQELEAPLDVRRHLIQVYDIGFIAGDPASAFMSMKLVPGRRTLDTEIKRFRRGGMPVETSLYFLRQLLKPLAWMHTLDVPVVHGDLKPDNVLVTEDGTLVLTDFGLAAHMPLGSLGGAIPYQAPETLLKQGADPRSDVYAAGLVWYEMLTARHPFENVDLEARARADHAGQVQAHTEARAWPIRPVLPGEDPVVAKRIAPVSERNPEFAEHPQLEAVLARCLAYKKSERYANARLLLDEIERYCKSGKVDASTVRGPTTAALPTVSVPTPSAKGPAELAADADALLARGDKQGALACLERIPVGKRETSDLKLLEAKIHLALGDKEALVRLTADAARLAPRNADVLNKISGLLHRAGMASRAQTYSDQARDLARAPGVPRG